MNKPRLKFLFLVSFCITMWLILPIQSSFVSSYFVVTMNSAFANDDPGCTNEDCPPDPGCTNEDCPPEYYAGCCCYQDYNPTTIDVIERLCCCKDKNKVSCRLSVVIDENHHWPFEDFTVTMGQIPSESETMCAPPWFVSVFSDPSWNLAKGCGWWKQISICGPDGLPLP